MRNFFKLIALSGKYKKYVALNILFNLLATAFSLFSFAMLIPLLKVLFNESEDFFSQSIDHAPALQLTAESLSANLNYFVAKSVILHGKEQTLVYICIFLVTMVMLRNLFTYLALYFIAVVRNGVIKDLRNNLYDKLTELQLSFFSEERKGDVLSKMTNDMKEIEWSILTSIEAVFRDPIQIIAYLGSLFFMSTSLTLFVLIFLPISGLAISAIGKSLKRSSGKAQSQIGKLLSTAEETLSGIKVIKGFNAAKRMREKFHKENDDYNRLMTKVYRKNDLASPVSEFMGVLATAVVLWYGGNLVFEQQLDSSFFILYLVLFSQLISPFKALTKAIYNSQRGLASLDRINEIIDTPITIKNIENPKSVKDFKDKILISNMSFKYEKEAVVKDLNLSIEKGKMIALVGQSGSGKTTLANLVPRFYDVSEGSILLDGEDIRNLDLYDLRQLMGIVTQESILFHDTVFNNIAFGMKNASREEVENAAKIANAHEFIMDLEHGYDTNIGDGGNKLSGGQKQRLSIARAVFKNPPILILDEATSALDTESEKLVQDALNKLMANRTSIVIAHRLSTIQHADEIIVMQKGNIVERGTHQVLMEKNGTYRKLVEMQSFG